MGPPYLSAEWFATEAISIISPAGQEATVCIEYHAVGDDGTAQIHQQIVSGQGLHGWHRGNILEADLVVQRGIAADRADLLQESVPLGTDSNTLVRQEGESRDLLTLGWTEDGPFDLLRGLSLQAAVEISNTPAGTISRSVAVADQYIRIEEGTPSDPDVTLTANWSDAIERLGGDRTIGHLLTRGASATGSLWKLSVLDWCVSGGAQLERGGGSLNLAPWVAWARCRETLSMLNGA
jgi:hypothetical protein